MGNDCSPPGSLTRTSLKERVRRPMLAAVGTITGSSVLKYQAQQIKRPLKALSMDQCKRSYSSAIKSAGRFDVTVARQVPDLRLLA
ncbi:hypothetical protein PSEEN2526 [Pseudomonas entomophila L48]|uniref:Uncharacterized protein n=1 Tax=Pseudomonas entomophila (strain L48) TaxID=384676 RepID=Q1IAI9_PSEE4|nr:hypothetical protein PSEEN2526 [Pseudomonas entomophila L48]